VRKEILLLILCKPKGVMFAGT